MEANDIPLTERAQAIKDRTNAPYDVFAYQHIINPDKMTEEQKSYLKDNILNRISIEIPALAKVQQELLSNKTGKWCVGYTITGYPIGFCELCRYADKVQQETDEQVCVYHADWSVEKDRCGAGREFPPGDYEKSPLDEYNYVKGCVLTAPGEYPKHFVCPQHCKHWLSYKCVECNRNGGKCTEADFHPLLYKLYTTYKPDKVLVVRFGTLKKAHLPFVISFPEYKMALMLVKDKELIVINDNYKDEVQELKEKYKEKVQEMKEKYEAQIQELKEKYEEKYESKIQSLKEQHEAEIQSLKGKIQSLKEQHEAQIQELKEKCGHKGVRLQDIEVYYKDYIRRQKEKLSTSYSKQLEEVNRKHNNALQSQKQQYESKLQSQKQQYESKLQSQKQLQQLLKAIADGGIQ